MFLRNPFRKRSRRTIFRSRFAFGWNYNKFRKLWNGSAHLDKLDVSGNDMLLWWERDDQTRLAVLYLESFGNPRKFARTARRVSCAMPVLTVLTNTGLAETTPFQETLFEQAGVITTGGFGEL